MEEAGDLFQMDLEEVGCEYANLTASRVSWCMLLCLVSPGNYISYTSCNKLFFNVY